MNDITQAYLECALWSSSDANDVPFDSNFDIDDVAPESEEQAEAVCIAFQKDNEELLVESELSDELIGYDLWLTRNGHGAGFWDRNLGEIGDKLTKACEELGEANLYKGDDGKLYIQN